MKVTSVIKIVSSLIVGVFIVHLSSHAAFFVSLLACGDQYVQLQCNYSGPDSSGYFEYVYTLSYEFILPEGGNYYPCINQLRIRNPYRISVIESSSPGNWEFKTIYSNRFFRWLTSNEANYLCPPNVLGGFTIKSRGAPGIVEAKARSPNYSFATGLTIGPTPEPLTFYLFLTGFGILLGWRATYKNS